MGYLIKSVVSEDYVQFDCVIYGLAGNFYDITKILFIPLPEGTEEDREELQNVILFRMRFETAVFGIKARTVTVGTFVRCNVRNGQCDVIFFSTNETRFSNVSVHSYSFQVW